MVNKSFASPSRLGTLKEWATARWDGIEQALARQTRPALADSNRDLAMGTASLGLTTAGLLTTQPLLILAGMPLVVFVYAPAFRSAWRSLRKQRRIDASVLDATRIAVCVVMGYYLAGAFNAALYALSQRMLAQSEEDFEESLRNLLGLQAEDAWAFVNGVEMQTRPDAVTSGQILIVNAGDLVPAAGIVLYGSAQVDQRLATGDVAPVQKEIGDTVLLASRIVSGQVAVTVGDNPARLDLTDLRETLRRSVQGKTFVQQLGEGSGNRTAPLSLLAFGLTIPFLGVNRAASFLCTSFGGNMRLLGPVGARHTIQQATQEGILIKESKALELANFVNCLVIDGQTLLDPSVRLYAAEIVQELRQRNWQANGLFGRPFAVYVVADREYDGLRGAAAALNAEEVFVEPLSIGRAAVIDNLQRSGRAVCYVGGGQESDQSDGSVMEKAMVSIALGGALSAHNSPAQIVFVEKSLAPLLTFFEMSTHFLRKERFSLLTPIMMDITDIFTTLVIHFGLIYSTFFNYGSLLISMRNARQPKIRILPEAEPVKTVAIVQISNERTSGARTGGGAKKADMREAKRKWSDLWPRRTKDGLSWLRA